MGTYFIPQVKAMLGFISTSDFFQPDNVDPQKDPKCAWEGSAAD